MFPLALYSLATQIFALDPDPHQALRIYQVRLIVESHSYTVRRRAPSAFEVASNARNEAAGVAWRDWETGGDPAQAIGTFRTLLNEDRSSIYQYDLARILQSEGRIREAAEMYWEVCHRPTRTGTYNPMFGNPGMIRIADALEDAGRTEDAAWAFQQTRAASRHDAYMQAAMLGSNPYWARKYMRKLLRDDPKDAEAKRWLGYAEAEIRDQKAKGQKPWTRDIPRE